MTGDGAAGVLSQSEGGSLALAPPQRAWGALLLVTIAGSLMIANAATIVMTPIMLVDPAASDFALQTGFRILLPIVLILLAVVAAALFGHAIRIGRQRAIWIATAFPAGFGAVTLMLLPLAIGGAVVAGQVGGGTFGLVLLGTPIILFAAFAEEILLRGVLQPVLMRAWGLWPAVLLSAGAFTAMHVAGGWRDPVTLANIFLASIWFGLLAERTGGLLAPTLAHFAYNWSEEILFGASPNPGVGPYGALFDLDLVGGMRLGGSADGMNASPILTVTLIVLVVLLVLDVRRRAQTAPVRTPTAERLRGGATRI